LCSADFAQPLITQGNHDDNDADADDDDDDDNDDVGPGTVTGNYFPFFPGLGPAISRALVWHSENSSSLSLRNNRPRH
jgi:hypothetical protein